MTWREKTIVRILLLVARIVSDDTLVREELHKLAVHIQVNAPKAEDA